MTALQYLPESCLERSRSPSLIIRFRVCAGTPQLPDDPGERGCHALASADLVILLSTFRQYDERPALGTVMLETGQADLWLWTA